jgi:rhodanese-related sulfurtransferase/glyoxylase-like metal-dependent hydrolase (beta-lactamase superfamily II)
MRVPVQSLVALGIGLALAGPSPLARGQDAEAATHGDEAATYQIVGTYVFPGFTIIQFDLATLSHFSYMLISDGSALVVDPGRDIESYAKVAKEQGVQVTGVWLTHSHADFVAGHVEFAKKFNVPIRISKHAGAGYEHIGLQDNDTLEIGEAVVTFMETPGHTPDSMCGLVHSKQDPKEPLALLTGDTLFVGSVGRPDLMGEGMSASTLASMMFDTWTQKLSKLPDDVMILPAHGSGSLCGAHLSDSPSSTIGEQRVTNSYLQYKNRGEFIAAILEGLPEAPQYFAHNAAMNKQGPEPVDWELASLPLVEPSADLTDPSKYYVLDLRDAAEYAAGHIPNSVNIALRGRLETWTGIMVPWESDSVVTGDEAEIREALHRLHRVGYQPRCILFETWKKAGLPLTRNEGIKPLELHRLMQTAESPIVVDVRRPNEWAEQRIGTVVNIPLNELTNGASQLDPSQRVVAVCNSAYRSSLAVGVLERKGFKLASSMEGGGEAWVEAGLPVLSSLVGSAAPTVARRNIRLPGRISATELKRLMLDLPSTIQLVDIRPPAHFADYRLPGSENVDVADLLESETHLNGAGSLIVLCRDGSLAMMVAGILSQKTDRDIKALYGGLEAYWMETGLGGHAVPGAASPSHVAPARSMPAMPAPSGSSTPIISKKRKRAGC